MPGWARTKQQIWESLHTSPPKTYAAAQRHYKTILNVGRHVDVGDLLAFLNILMGPLKEKEDKAKSEIASLAAGKSRESPGCPASENPPNPSMVPVPKRLAHKELGFAHKELGDPDPEPAPLATPDSADKVEESCVAVPTLAYPAYVGHVVTRVREALSAVPGADVLAFGSAVSGFGDRTSDIDLVVTATKASLVKGLELEGGIARGDLAPRSLSKLHTRLQEHGFRIRECVLGAQMPILKMSIASGSSDCSGDIECDLSVNNLLPVFNTALLKAYADIDHRAVEVTQACKRWAKAEGVHGASLGHLSSYAFTLMVIFYMQVKGALPCLQCRAQEVPQIYREEGKEYNVARAVLASMAWEPAKEVAITFSGFVSFFCQEFKWGESVVSIRTGQCLSKKDFPRLRMRPREGMTPEEWGAVVHIEDPFDIERNLNSVLGPTHSEKLRLALLNHNAIVEPNEFAGGPTSSEASGWETSS